MSAVTTCHYKHTCINHLNVCQKFVNKAENMLLVIPEQKNRLNADYYLL